ncbi:hypothetical protein KXD40_008964 [Peronospora effusa]|uniref:Uncharacterized protein n=1 Tax=Peronospora effusa TaxID=542832 RepID=A0A425CP79_9STRA|nr:hypothetical protein DD237_007600 [Peronospora effusa]UIZ22073.1 hypothetical protein KXD40_008964 [Peronospora effusa]
MCLIRRDAHTAPPAKISDHALMLVSGESYLRLGLAKLTLGIDDGLPTGGEIEVHRVLGRVLCLPDKHE